MEKYFSIWSDRTNPSTTIEAGFFPDLKRRSVWPRLLLSIWRCVMRANGRDGESTCAARTVRNTFRSRCRAWADVFAAIAVALAAFPVHAQSYPAKLIKVVLPYTAGSPNDVIARFFAPYLSAQLGQPVMVENRPGGSTSIGTKLVASSEADGYTLLFSNTPTHVIAALGNASISYDPLQDFAPIAAIASSSLVLVIAPAIPARSVPELVAYAKGHPGKLNFGFGQGTLPHLAGELFKAVTATNIVSIPYRGGSQAISDLLGGRIHMNFGAGSTLLPLIREGKLRPLAVTSSNPPSGTARSTDHDRSRTAGCDRGHALWDARTGEHAPAGRRNAQHCRESSAALQ